MKNAKPGVTWDYLTRGLHWALALSVVFNLFILEEGGEPHRWLGYAAVGFVFVRALWGFWGPSPSNFRAFPVGPTQVLHYLKSRLDSTPYEGHNPLASLAYIAIWFLILCLGVSGYMMGTDRYFGEEWLETLHAQFSTALQILIGVHLLGLVVDSLRYRRKTWLAMITGRK